MKNQRICNLRAVAILMVVLGHSIILYSPSWTLYESNTICIPLAMIYRIIDIIQMPLYFSISGYLFYYSQGRNTDFMRFVKNKAKRLLVPFLVFSLCWMVPIKLLVNYSGYQDQSIMTIIVRKTLWGTDNGHLWFLVALFLIFVVMYFVCRYLYAHKDDVFNIIVLIVLLICSYFSYGLGAVPCLRNAVLYMFWFFVGFLFNYYHQHFTVRKKVISVVGVIAGIAAIVLYFAVSHSAVKYIAAFLCVAVLYYIVPDRTNKLTRKIDEDSYGIYLFHSPLIYITCTYLLNANPILVLFINFIVFGGFSMTLTELVRKTKLKLIIGE